MQLVWYNLVRKQAAGLKVPWAWVGLSPWSVTCSAVARALGLGLFSMFRSNVYTTFRNNGS